MFYIRYFTDIDVSPRQPTWKIWVDVPSLGSTVSHKTIEIPYNRKTSDLKKIPISAVCPGLSPPRGLEGGTDDPFPITGHRYT